MAEPAVMITVNRETEMVEHGDDQITMVAPGTVQMHIHGEDGRCKSLALDPAAAASLGRTLSRAARIGRKAYQTWQAEDAS